MWREVARGRPPAVDAVASLRGLVDPSALRPSFRLTTTATTTVDDYGGRRDGRSALPLTISAVQARFEHRTSNVQRPTSKFPVRSSMLKVRCSYRDHQPRVNPWFSSSLFPIRAHQAEGLFLTEPQSHGEETINPVISHQSPLLLLSSGDSCPSVKSVVPPSLFPFRVFPWAIQIILLPLLLANPLSTAEDAEAR